MGNAILHSSQYQNYRRIDLIVIHCSATRATQHMKGTHATGYNRHSIGICYEGGLDIRGRPCDTRTPEQKDTLLKLLVRLRMDYPQIKVVGHRDLPGVRKDCPCFKV